MAETKKIGRGVALLAQSDLFATVSGFIEEARRTLARQANSTTVFLFWRIGQQVNSEILHHERAEYGQKIVSTLATQLVASYGRSFEARNLRRMMQFAEQFPHYEIVSALTTQLSWAHVVEVLPLKTAEVRLFYLSEAATRQLATRDLRRMIHRKAFERKEIANAQLTETSAIPLDTFKDPYLMDVLGLHDGFLEADLEAAVLRELESFILELGGGFTFVARQKRMIIGGEDFHLDLLFFHRRLKRLVAVELLCGAPHKSSSVAFPVMWRPAVGLLFLAAVRKIGRHISEVVIGSARNSSGSYRLASGVRFWFCALGRVREPWLSCPGLFLHRCWSY